MCFYSASVYEATQIMILISRVHPCRLHLSLTLRHCVKTAKPIIEILLPPDKN